MTSRLARDGPSSGRLGLRHGLPSRSIPAESEVFAGTSEGALHGESATASGSYLWAKHFSNFATTVANNVSVDPSTGTVALTGAFQGTASFGVGTLTSAGANDIFLLTLAPYGSDTRRRDRWAA